MSGTSEGNGDLDGRARSGLACDVDPPTNGNPPVLEIPQPEADLGGGRVESPSVVVNLQDGLFANSMKADSTGRRLRVLADVGESLTRELNQVGRTGRELRRYCSVDVGHRGHAALFSKLSGQVLESLLELAISEDSGTKAKDVVAQVTDGAVDLATGGLDPRFHLGIAAAGRGRLQTHSRGEQRLDDAVVEFAADPLALVEHAETAQLALRPTILEGHRGLVGKGLDQPDRLLVEAGPAHGIGHG